jgi:hypothetical protein
VNQTRQRRGIVSSSHRPIDDERRTQIGRFCRSPSEFTGPPVAGYWGSPFSETGFMLRASAFASGLFIALWGAAFLVVDQVVLFNPPADKESKGIRGMLKQTTIGTEQRPIIDPTDWTAFTLMSIGSVTMLYSVALPKKAS